MGSPAVAPLGTEGDPTAPSFGPWKWLFAAALVVVVFLVYQPAWQGGVLFDDKAHLTPPAFRSWYGLYRIWLNVLATQQYYPMSFSTFWVEYKLWGDATLGYHLVNIFLHARRHPHAGLGPPPPGGPRRVPGGGHLGLHPVCVESVAWITELKTPLRRLLPWRLLLYLHFDRTRKVHWYLGDTRLVRAGPAEQDRHGDAAGGAAADLLVATGTRCVARVSGPSNNNTARMAVPRVAWERDLCRWRPFSSRALWPP